MHKALAFLCATTLALTVSTLAGAAPGTDSMVTVGSNPSPFAQNKQNEPAMAIDANHPNIVVAGANDNIDMSRLYRARRQVVRRVDSPQD